MSVEAVAKRSIRSCASGIGLHVAVEAAGVAGGVGAGKKFLVGLLDLDSLAIDHIVAAAAEIRVLQAVVGDRGMGRGLLGIGEPADEWSSRLDAEAGIGGGAIFEVDASMADLAGDRSQGCF